MPLQKQKKPKRTSFAYSISKMSRWRELSGGTPRSQNRTLEENNNNNNIVNKSEDIVGKKCLFMTGNREARYPANQLPSMSGRSFLDRLRRLTRCRRKITPKNLLFLLLVVSFFCCGVQVFLLRCCTSHHPTDEDIYLGRHGAGVRADRLRPNLHILSDAGSPEDPNAQEPLVNQPAHMLLKRDVAIAQDVATKYLTPNEIIRKTAIGIKTFNRPDCLRLSVKSFRTYYPEIPIFVADDSFEDDLANLTREGINYIRLPKDSGVAYGRNRLVKAIYDAGYEYMVMSDDDYTLNEADDLLMLAFRFLLTGADILSPVRCDYGRCERSKGTIHIDSKRQVTIFPNITIYPPQAVPTCHRSDIIQQFFFTRTKTILDVGWDDVLKNNDHYDFLFNAKSHGLRLVTCNDIKIIHDKKTCQLQSKHFQEYIDTRQVRWYNLLPYVFKKWSLKKITDETGKVIWIHNNGTALFKFAEKISLNRTDPLHEYFISAVVNSINAKEPGWTWLRPLIESKKTFVIYKKFHECVYYVGGKIDVDYDRHSSYPNKRQVVPFATYHFNRSCSIAEDLWTLRHYGEEEKSHVYYVVSVSNDLVHLKRLVDLFAANQDTEDSSLVVVDMGTTETRVKLSDIHALLPVHLLYLGPPFSRSIGLKKGMDLVTTLASQSGESNPIAFAIDTSIVIPPNFSDLIRGNVRCGVSAYAPICYKFKNESDGYWVNTGYGMVSMCLKDYHRAGGYDDRWGYKWGAEDVDLCNRLKEVGKLNFLSRPQQEGFYHKHSGSTRKTYKGYYKKKNMYDKPLPITPMTTDIPEEGLEERVANFAKSRLEENISGLDLTFLSAQQTPVNNGENVWYDVRLINKRDGRKFFAIVDSILA